MNTPVSFEIAKLLKEKGLHLKVRSMYCEGKLFKDTKSKGNYNDVIWVRTWRNSPTDDTVSAPTIAEVVMWLYETHGIWITVTSISQESWQCHMTKKGDSLGKCYFEDFYNPTEAYEAAIEHCLTKLI